MSSQCKGHACAFVWPSPQPISQLIIHNVRKKMVAIVGSQFAGGWGEGWTGVVLRWDRSQLLGRLQWYPNRQTNHIAHCNTLCIVWSHKRECMASSTILGLRPAKNLPFSFLEGEIGRIYSYENFDVFLLQNITLYILMFSDKSLHISTLKNIMCDILQANM